MRHVHDTLGHHYIVDGITAVMDPCNVTSIIYNGVQSIVYPGILQTQLDQNGNKCINIPRSLSPCRFAPRCGPDTPGHLGACGRDASW